MTETTPTPSGKAKPKPLVLVLVALSVVLMAAGLLWGTLAGSSSDAYQPTSRSEAVPEGAPPSGVDPSLVTGFTAKGPGGQSAGQTRTGSSPGPDGTDGSSAIGSENPEAVFRLGFGFAMGFGVAFALRKLFKITVAALGLVVLLLMGLQHAGLIEIRWGAMAASYDSAQDWVGGQFGSARAFITGAIPMSATALAGLAAGWKAG